MSNQTPKINQPIKKGIAKTPVVMQLEALECGAACLAMILGYYNTWIPLEQVRIDCGVSRDGSSAKNIYKAALKYGLDVEAYKFEVDEIREEGTFPCIIHWDFNHFVVLKGFKGKYVYLNDPARGDIRISIDEFDKGFTGICLVFKPKDNYVPSGKKLNCAHYINDKLRGLGVMVAFGVVMTIFTSLIGLITPVFSRVFYDNILTGRNPNWAYPFLMILTIIYAVQVLISLLTTLYNYRATGKLDIVGSSAYMWKVMHLPIRFFSQRMSGDIVSRKETNAVISKQIINTISPLFIQSIMMILYFCIIINYSWVLTLVALGSTIINLICSQVITKKRMNIARMMLRDTSKSSATAVSGIEMIESIKASGAEDGYFCKWAGYQAGSNGSQVKYQKISTYYGLIPQIFSALCTIITLSIALYLVIKGEFTLGLLTAFQGYLTSFLAPVNNLITAGKDLQEMQTSIERIDDVMKYPNDSVFDESKIKEKLDSKLSGNIEMKNVTFGYSSLEEPLIKNFNMSVKQGSSVAFVGTSGCGKSTLSKLITGIEKPWSGEILFDNKNINEIDRSIFTASIAVVDQDIIVFEDSIRNNIKMYDSSIEDFEMILAARDAQLHEDIMQRDGGYDYVLCEGGKDFSGGQRQRLEIARILAQDPTICILDEATSALDAKTENNVVKSIKSRGITCIVIAHRLSTIRNCDEIIVLDHGNVVERGTHNELIKNNGYYARLINAD